MSNMLEQIGDSNLNPKQYQLVKDDPHLDDE
jgi:hypothetical protein